MGGLGSRRVRERCGSFPSFPHRPQNYQEVLQLFQAKASISPATILLHDNSGTMTAEFGQKLAIGKARSSRRRCHNTPDIGSGSGPATSPSRERHPRSRHANVGTSKRTRVLIPSWRGRYGSPAGPAEESEHGAIDPLKRISLPAKITAADASHVGVLKSRPPGRQPRA